MQPDAPSSAALCTEQEIRALVHDFYADVRRDDVLGPIFNSRIHDWDTHLAKLVDFWSSILLRTGRFTGAPMPLHAAMPGLSADLFQRWLAAFYASNARQPNQAMAAQANAMAERIAQSLWMGYQMRNGGEALPTPLEAPRHG